MNGLDKTAAKLKKLEELEVTFVRKPKRKHLEDMMNQIHRVNRKDWNPLGVMAYYVVCYEQHHQKKWNGNLSKTYLRIVNAVYARCAEDVCKSIEDHFSSLVRKGEQSEWGPRAGKKSAKLASF